MFRDDAKMAAENNVSLLNSLAHVARVKDKERNMKTNLKAKKELHFNEKQDIKSMIVKLIQWLNACIHILPARSFL